MIRFVREDQLAKEFKRLPEPADGVTVAAPFWGKGATKMLGLARRERVRIICTFDALACNPVELAKLRKVGAEIRSNARLHAKIYYSGSSVIVGSSNPSRYGLTLEGDTLTGSVEGNVLTDDKAVVEDARRMIDDLWNHADTVRITGRMIQKEIERRALLPVQFVRRGLKSKTLLAACREAPELFNSVYVAAYSDGLDEGAKAELQRLQAQAQAPAFSENEQSAIFKNCWGYQFKNAPPSGAWLVALDCKGKKPKVWGASKVPSPFLALAIPGGSDLYPTIRGVITVPGASGAFRISAKEKTQLAGISKKMLRADYVPLRKAVAFIDK